MSSSHAVTWSKDFDAILTISARHHSSPCVVHMVRNSLRYVFQEALAENHQPDASHLHSPHRPGSEAVLEEFADDWRGTYPAMIGAGVRLGGVRAIPGVPTRPASSTRPTP